jgi:hypothetical protein
LSDRERKIISVVESLTLGLAGIANELLLSTTRNELPQRDEKLLLQHTSAPQPRAAKRVAQR